MGLSFWRFLAVSAVGALLWALVPVVAGMLLSAQVEQALAWLEHMGARGLLVIGVIIAMYVAAKLIQRYLLIRYLRSARVDVDELRAMMDASAPLVVLDVRSASARKMDARHTPGSIAVNIAEAEKCAHR
jgi:uncharacterized protein YneF (UPF0154 family)